MILDDLDAEFATELAALTSPWPALPGTLTDVMRHVRGNPDPSLFRLLVHLAEGDQLAGRVVVQALLPKLRVLARQGHDEGALVAHLWLVAASYPLTHRPHRVAANLALDARKRVAAEAAWRERPAGLAPDLAPAPSVDAALDEVGALEVLDRAVALALVSPATRVLLEDVYRVGLSGREAAVRHGLSEPAARQRCSRAVRHLAAHRRQLVA